MKNVLELAGFTGATVNAVFSALDDGKLDFSDIAKFIDPVLKGSDAIKDINLVGAENAALTIPQRDQVNAELLRSMPMVDQSTADDITRIAGGILAAYRVGYNLGRAKLIEDLRTGAINASDLLDSE